MTAAGTGLAATESAHIAVCPARSPARSRACGAARCAPVRRKKSENSACTMAVSSSQLTRLATALIGMMLAHTGLRLPRPKPSSPPGHPLQQQLNEPVEAPTSGTSARATPATSAWRHGWRRDAGRLLRDAAAALHVGAMFDLVDCEALLSAVELGLDVVGQPPASSRSSTMSRATARARRPPTPAGSGADVLGRGVRRWCSRSIRSPPASCCAPPRGSRRSCTTCAIPARRRFWTLRFRGDTLAEGGGVRTRRRGSRRGRRGASS